MKGQRPYTVAYLRHGACALSREIEASPDAVKKLIAQLAKKHGKLLRLLLGSGVMARGWVVCRMGVYDAGRGTG